MRATVTDATAGLVTGAKSTHHTPSENSEVSWLADFNGESRLAGAPGTGQRDQPVVHDDLA